MLAAVHGGALAGQNVEILGYRDPTHVDFAQDATPWLEEPIGEMGRLAGEAIIRRIADPGTEPQAMVLRATFSDSRVDGARAR